MRLGFADLGRLRRSVNSIAFARQADPNQTHRVVGSRLDGKRLVGAHILERVFRIVVIRRIFADAGDLQSAARRRLFRAPDRGRINRQKLLIGAEDLEHLGILVDLDAAGFLRQIVRRNISNHDLVARGLEFFSPIERAEQFLAHVEFLGELFARARVSQGRKLLHALQLGRNFFNKWTAHVVR